jgi:hypothetical protein
MIADHFPDHLDPQDQKYKAYPHHLSVDQAQELSDMYCVERLTMNEAAEQCPGGGIARESFMAFRKAHVLRKDKAVIVDESKTIAEAIDHFDNEKKRREIDRKARRRQRREQRKAARKWWSLEESMNEAAKAFRNSKYNPPKLKVSLGETPTKNCSVVSNAQDYHIGKRPAYGADDWSVSDYCDRLVESFERGLQQSLRNAQLDRIYIVIGGDLVHVDGADGATTAGTPQDLSVSPTEALKQSIDTMVRHVDLARQAASEVRLVGLTGNHDKVLSQACFEAIKQRFYSNGKVSVAGTGERIYDRYRDRLLAFTHGDISKRKFKKIGDIITAEARSLMGETKDTTLFTGHYHFKQSDIVDESGRLQIQAPSPSPDDDHHVGEGHVGARKQIQLYLTRPHTQDDMTLGLGLN